MVAAPGIVERGGGHMVQSYTDKSVAHAQSSTARSLVQPQKAHSVCKGAQEPEESVLN